jgi:hypothetical protein
VCKCISGIENKPPTPVLNPLNHGKFAPSDLGLEVGVGLGLQRGYLRVNHGLFLLHRIYFLSRPNSSISSSSSAFTLCTSLAFLELLLLLRLGQHPWEQHKHTTTPVSHGWVCVQLG